MDQNYLNDPEFQELIKQYVEYLTSVLPELKDNLLQKDYLKIQKFGHNLKGSGGGYGLTEMSKIGQQIEEESKQQSHVKLVELIASFEVELTKSQKKYAII